MSFWIRLVLMTTVRVLEARMDVLNSDALIDSPNTRRFVKTFGVLLHVHIFKALRNRLALC